MAAIPRKVEQTTAFQQVIARLQKVEQVAACPRKVEQKAVVPCMVEHAAANPDRRIEQAAAGRGKGGGQHGQGSEGG